MAMRRSEGKTTQKQQISGLRKHGFCLIDSVILQKCLNQPGPQFSICTVKTWAGWSLKSLQGFSGGSDGKESACYAGDSGSIPG